MVFNRVLRAGEGRIIRRLRAVADQVNAIEEDFVALSDAELRGQRDAAGLEPGELVHGAWD